MVEGVAAEGLDPGILRDDRRIGKSAKRQSGNEEQDRRQQQPDDVLQPGHVPLISSPALCRRCARASRLPLVVTVMGARVGLPPVRE